MAAILNHILKLIAPVEASRKFFKYLLVVGENLHLIQIGPILVPFLADLCHYGWEAMCKVSQIHQPRCIEEPQSPIIKNLVQWGIIMYFNEFKPLHVFIFQSIF